MKKVIKEFKKVNTEFDIELEDCPTTFTALLKVKFLLEKDPENLIVSPAFTLSFRFPLLSK